MHQKYFDVLFLDRAKSIILAFTDYDTICLLFFRVLSMMTTQPGVELLKISASAFESLMKVKMREID